MLIHTFQALFVLTVFINCTQSFEDGSQLNGTGMVPCTNDSGTTSCNIYEDLETSLTTDTSTASTRSSQQVPLTSDSSIATTTSPPWVYVIDNDWDEVDSSVVDTYIRQAGGQEYIGRFEDVFQKLLIQTVLYYCPYATLCNFTLALTPPPPPVDNFGNVPCCYNCSCNPDCVYERNCCPDHHDLLSEVDLGVTESCMEPVIRHWSLKNFNSENDRRVLSFQDCPHNTDETLKLLCAESYALFSNISLDDVIPVSDKYTSNTYRNRHCAICNGVKLSDMTSWNVSVACLERPLLASIDDLLPGILHGDMPCDLTFQPPDFINVKNCSHIDACNVTGLWREFDPFLERACDAYEMKTSVPLYKHGLFLRMEFFKNPSCLECNGYMEDPVTYLCPVKPFTFFPSIPYTFSGLLWLNTHDGSDMHDDTTCGSGYLFDDITKRCQKVICPYHWMVLNDRCEPFLTTSETIKYRVFSILRPSADVFLEDLYELVAELITQVDDIIVSFGIGSIAAQQSIIVLEKDVFEDDTAAIVDRIELQFDILPSFDPYSSQPNNNPFSQQPNDNPFIQPNNHPLTVEEIVDILLGLDELNITVNRSKGGKIRFDINLKDDTRGFSDQEAYSNFYNWTLYGTPVPLQDLVDLRFTEQGRVNIPYFQWDFPPTEKRSERPGTVVRLLTMRSCQYLSINMTEFGIIETPNGLKLEASADILIALSHYALDDTSPSLVQMCMDTYRRVFQLASIGDSTNDALLSAELAISITSVSISLVCLGVSLLAYCCLPELQTLPGKNNMALIVSLLLAQCFYLLGSYGRLDTDYFECKFVGGLTHFFWLHSLFWMNACTFHMFRVLVKMQATTIVSLKKYLQYHIYCIIMSAAFVCINVIFSLITSDYSKVGYGNQRCYISTQRMIDITFGIPTAFVIISNLSMFISIILKFKRASGVRRHFKNERNYFMVFSKLSTITGTTWLFGFLYMWTGVTAFSFVFIILNGSQGLFLMLSFVCNARTFRMVKERVSSNRKR